MDPSGEPLVDAELCTCRGITAEVCVVDTGGTLGAVAAAPDTRVALVVVPQVLVTTLVVATVTDVTVVCVVVVIIGNGAELAPVEAVNGGGILTVFSEVVGGVVGVMCSLEGAVCNGVVPWTPSVARVVTVTVFVLFVVGTLADVEVEAQVVVDTAEEVLATEMVPTCGAT